MGAAASLRTDPKVPVLLINLDRDARRLKRVVASLRGQHVETTRISAVLGSSLPRTVTDFVPGASGMQRGTLGCFLSHVRAWETLLALGYDSAIILEDDAKVVRDLHDCLETTRRAGVDFVFINSRMAPALDSEAAGAPGEWMSVTEAILARAHTGQLACGTDGYVVTRAGATALLDAVRKYGVQGDVDWVVAYATLGATSQAAISHSHTFSRKFREVGRFYDFPAPIVSGAVLRKAAVRHGHAGSTRLEQNALSD